MTATAASNAITTVDPSSGTPLAEYAVHDRAAVDAALDRAVEAFAAWRYRRSDERAERLSALAARLRARKSELALLATHEMGKTIVEAEAEIEKCAVCCDHYARHGAAALADERVTTSATESYVAFRPLGVLLAIMPWNFPYWQAFRALVPAMLAGNAVVLKHAANVTGCALEIERVVHDAGFPEGTFTTLIVASRDMEAVVADPRIAAVTLTGSEAAGSAVAATAGRQLKKTVLELGGSDAFIVLRDADVEAAAATAVKARFQNNGQSCIAAKRFIIEASVHDAFLEAFVAKARGLRIGAPSDRTTQLGPLAREDLRESLAVQVERSRELGARIATGGTPLERRGYYYAPTILSDVKPGMPAFDEETFGPVAAVVRASDLDECVTLANASQYGLGGNLWSRDIERAKSLAARLESGAVFINGMTASDPRLPFGGVKKSGYGRELAAYGIREFVNVQTVWIGPARDEQPSATSAE